MCCTPMTCIFMPTFKVLNHSCSFAFVTQSLTLIEIVNKCSGCDCICGHVNFYAKFQAFKL